jgi:ABC-2 type transport system ATP-binding protein
MTPNTVIESTALTRRFRGCEAVQGVDLAVPEGTVFAYLGPNGAGKTTTIRMLLGMLRPSAGSARVLGVESSRLGRREFARIGFVSADQKLPRRMSLQELVNYLAPMYPTWDGDFCTKLAKDFDLPLERKLGALSRGMRMKAALLAALAFHPRLLVLDEPFSGLDPLVREEFLSGIIDLTEQEQWTVFVSSHDLDDVQRLADWVGIIDHGRLQVSEPVDTLQARFRRIRFRATGAAAADDRWMEVEHQDGLVRLVDTAYEDQASLARLKAAYPSASDWEILPMSLREIFVTLARHGRRNGDGAS